MHCTDLADVCSFGLYLLPYPARPTESRPSNSALCCYCPLQGGFYTTLDRYGSPVLEGPAGDKFLVPAARQLFMFSTLALKDPANSNARDLAKRAYDFLTKSALWDSGEGLFRWQVSRDGKTVVHPEKVLYGQAFAILGLARYGRALGDAAAVDLAYKVFEKVDSTRHDSSHGGYSESVEASFPPGVNIGNSPGTDKSHNTHLHLIEAFTELSRALEGSKGSDGSSGSSSAGGGGRQAAVNARLSELVGLLPSKLWQPSSQHIGTEFTADWKVLDPAAKLYAHEIELVYFLLSALDQLSRAGVQLPADTELAVRVGRAAQEGYDNKTVGFWQDGDAGGRYDQGLGVPGLLAVPAWWW